MREELTGIGSTCLAPAAAAAAAVAAAAAATRPMRWLRVYNFVAFDDVEVYRQLYCQVLKNNLLFCLYLIDTVYYI